MGRTHRKRLDRRRRNLASKSEESPDCLPALYKYLSTFGWENETKLTARTFPNTGRGLCSKQLIKSEDILMRLPLQALITIATLEADDAFKSLFDDSKFNKDERVPFQSLMALYLLHHRHLAQQSPLQSYLGSIPSSFSTPYFCTINELYCLPEAILEITAEQNRKIRSSYKNLKAAFADPQCNCCGQTYFDEIFTLATFKWAYFAINSRCVYVNSRQIKNDKSFFESLLSDETNLALSPFLDLFNHSDEVSTTAELRRNPKKELEFVLTLEHAPKSVRPYTQLYISYGALGNLKLLTEYGFFLPGNRHEYFEFSLLDIENFIKGEKTFSERSYHRNKFKFIRDHNLDDQMFVHLNEGMSHNLRVVLHLIFKEPSHFPNVLNQVAFGAAEQFTDVDEESNLLVRFKVSEYQSFITDLQKLGAPSESGRTVMQYMEECIRYLDEYLELN